MILIGHILYPARVDLLASSTHFPDAVASIAGARESQDFL